MPSTQPNERAARYLASQKPVDPKKHAQMLFLFRETVTPEELRTAVVHFTLDLSFSRADIVHCLGVVEREKGWA